MHVHTRLLGMEIDLSLHPVVRDLSQRSHAHLKRLVQQCALSGLTLLAIALVTIVTLVGVVTTVSHSQARAETSLYAPIPKPVTGATPMGAYLQAVQEEQWSLDDQDQWAVQGY